MSSRFTPRRTLQSTPAVCETRRPPRLPSDSLPARYDLPDTLYCGGYFPDPQQISAVTILATAILYRQGAGVDQWFGHATIWGHDSTIRFGMPHSTGIMGLDVEYQFSGNLLWAYANRKYALDWPEFATEIEVTPNLLFPAQPPARIQVTI